MMKFKIFLVTLIFGIIYILLGDAYSHKGERHENHATKDTETRAESKIESNFVGQKEIASPPAPHEGHAHSQTVEIGSFNLIQISKKQGYTIAVIFTGFIAVIWGAVSFYPVRKPKGRHS